MTQQDFLNNLRGAKASHVKWHAQALALAMGFDTGKESVPKLYSNCTFGKWYYGTGQFISNISSFVEIEPLHVELHNIYMEIYQTHIEPAKKGLFESQDKANKKKKQELESLTNKLKDISTLLIQKITEVEDSILKMDNDQFVNNYITPKRL
jgi:TRAP-type mannitol/chloroaromatic compound transport system substrate-binding protein